MALSDYRLFFFIVSVIIPSAICAMDLEQTKTYLIQVGDHKNKRVTHLKSCSSIFKIKSIESAIRQNQKKLESPEVLSYIKALGIDIPYEQDEMGNECVNITLLCKKITESRNHLVKEPFYAARFVQTNKRICVHPSWLTPVQ